jgi:hypothetical protein
VVCCFDPSGPLVAAFDIHEWLHDVFKIPEHIVNAIQMEGPKRQVYIKFIEQSYVQVQALIRDTNGQAEHKHTTGELSIVNITNADMGTKRVRIANFPPEVQNASIRTALAPFGTSDNNRRNMVKNIQIPSREWNTYRLNNVS